MTAVTDLRIYQDGTVRASCRHHRAVRHLHHQLRPVYGTGVKVEDNVPAGTELVSVTASHGATCNAGVPGNALASDGLLLREPGAGASRTMTVVIRVLPGTRGPLNNDARVTSQTFDDDLSDQPGHHRCHGVGSADLSITKSDSPTRWSRGRS